MNSLIALQDNLQSLTSLLAVTSLPEPSQLSQWGSWLYNIGLVAVGLGFVIFVHELGHFLAAKFFGVKCEKFYIGFDVPIRLGPIKLPAKLVHFKWGETEYGVGASPLGGYVKMLGQDDDPRKAEEEMKRIRSEGGDPDSASNGLDPRSYPAKPVYARMVIISAGVIMNLIFGVLFAAVAFMYGVPYTPTVIGDTTPGDPAWVNGLQPGDRILQVSNDRPETEELRFNDMTEAVRIQGIDDPNKTFPIVISRNGERIEKSFSGTLAHDEKGKIISLGVVSANTTKVASNKAFNPFTAFEAAQPNSKTVLPDLHLGDTIVAIDGVELPEFPGQNAPALFELEKYLDPKFDQSVSLTVKSAAKEGETSQTRTVEWKPVPRHTLGFSLAVGPIKAIAEDSPAKAANVGLGDRPVSLNGEPIENGATLRLAVAKLASQEATLTLKRMSNNSEEEELYDFTWQVPEEFNLTDVAGAQLAVPGYELPGSGLVVHVLREISQIQAGSAADTAGLQAGDMIQQIEVVEQEGELKTLFSKMVKASFYEPRTLDGFHNAIHLDEVIQTLPVGTKLRLSINRGGQIKNTELVIQHDPNWMAVQRGVMFTPMSAIYKEPQFGTALGLGVSEVWRRMVGVVDFLRMLVTRKMEMRMMGGPGVIFYAASMEASAGPSRLLLFLTMLSANLAIINFLPIPALDGGHMMFLTVEAIRGRPVDENLQMQLTLGGVLALLSLMVFVIINDVLNLTQHFS